MSERANKFRLSQGYSLAAVLGLLCVLLIAACVFRFSQLPDDLGIGLGRGNRIANILLVATPGKRARLALFTGSYAGIEYPDKQGIFNRARDFPLTSAEHQIFENVYQAWCATPPRRTYTPGRHFYKMGFSCQKAFGRYIEVEDEQLPPIFLGLLKRAASLPMP